MSSVACTPADVYAAQSRRFVRGAICFAGAALVLLLSTANLLASPSLAGCDASYLEDLPRSIQRLQLVQAILLVLVPGLSLALGRDASVRTDRGQGSVLWPLAGLALYGSAVVAALTNAGFQIFSQMADAARRGNGGLVHALLHSGSIAPVKQSLCALSRGPALVVFLAGPGLLLVSLVAWRFAQRVAAGDRPIRTAESLRYGIAAWLLGTLGCTFPGSILAYGIPTLVALVLGLAWLPAFVGMGWIVAREQAVLSGKPITRSMKDVQRPALRARLALILGVLLLGAGFGCASGPNPHNPLVSQRLPSGKRFAESRGAERRHGLPDGVLGAEASLISLDANHVCFDVILRTTNLRPELTDPRNWRALLIGETPDFESQEVDVQGISAVRSERYVWRGHELVALAAQACQLAGTCDDERVNKATWSGPQLEVLTGGGMVCFPTAGRVLPSTDVLVLRLDDMRSPRSARVRYDLRWEFR